ncbi:diguanylate cyclase (GGDEF)-like protein [Natronospira proteinivora]|uniref:diguanylate cyclase n=1 Tax=Natronospira proteinivora TaxID=1807133 RepID=A0ABT1G9H0_9GAMM|nr:diguanylate cyclase [Natronospira proteinivora]MCP1727970.1 diguanylate cyclase (GGDEF)-like protein [Natronospira proteinivora]
MLMLPLIYSLAAPSEALDPARDVDQYIHEIWTSQDGLPQNSVNGLTLGPQGYLWLATYDGLIRFDGQRFERLEDDALPGRRLRIIGDNEQGFWISGELRGLAFFDGESAQAVELNGDEMNWPLSHIKGDLDEAWIGANNGLFHLSQGRLRQQDNGLPTDSAIMKLARFGPENRLAAGGLAGLFVQQEDGFRQIAPSALGYMAVYSLLASGDTLWAGGDAGLYRVDMDADTDAPTVSATGWQWPASDSASIRALHQDSEKNIWAGIQGRGVGRMNEHGHQLLTRDQGLSNHNISDFFQGPEGSLWIGTDGGGLNRLRNGEIIAYGGERSAINHSILPIIEGKDGDLWLGGVCSGVHRFRDGEVLASLAEEEGLDNSCVYSLLMDSDGTLWAGTYGGGVFRRQNGGDFQQLALADSSGDEASLDDNIVVTALTQSDDGRIWLGSNQGLFLYQPEANHARRIAGSSDHFIQQITLHDQTLWLATTQGAYLASLPEQAEDRLATSLTIKPLSDDSRLVDVRVREILPDEDGVWIGTYGSGLQFWDGEDLHGLGREQGLQEMVVSRILRTDNDDLLLSGNQGISRVSREALMAVIRGEQDQAVVELLGVKDGMLVAETNGGGQPAGIRDSQGRYWFPTVDGIVLLEPGRMERNLRPPPVHIEEIRVAGETQGLEGPISIPAQRREVEIRFTGLSFIAPERMQFRYRLDEEAPWVDVGNRRTLHLAHLQGGRHRLEIMAANENGIWSEETATIVLEVEPPFRETLWFPLSLVAAVAAGLGGLFALGLLRARRQRAYLQALVQERTAALEAANRKLTTQASQDGLTGAGNRHVLRSRLRDNWEDCRARQAPMSLLMMDIDHFKEYNDVHGHVEGDNCLKRIVQALNPDLRPVDSLIRYGGEEFVVLLPDTDAVAAASIAERLRQTILSLALPHDASPVERVVTISIGTATVCPHRGGTSTSLLRAADEALYQAKAQGRNCIRQAEPATGDSDDS